MKDIIFHGETIIKKIEELPKNSIVIRASGHYVIAPSETTGNDHRVEVLDDTFIYEKYGVIYIRNESPTKVFCPNETRHATEVLEPGIWEIGIAKEFDYLKMEKRKVAD